MKAQIIALSNQKGGVIKSTTCVYLGIGLAKAGKKVLIIDNDPQASLSISLGYQQPDKLPCHAHQYDGEDPHGPVHRARRGHPAPFGGGVPHARQY